MGGVAERHRREVSRLLKRLPAEARRACAAAPGASFSRLMERRRTEAEAARPPVRTTLRALPRPQPETEPSYTATPIPVASPEALHPAGGPGLTAAAAAAPVKPGGMSRRRRP